MSYKDFFNFNISDKIKLIFDYREAEFLVISIIELILKKQGKSLQKFVKEEFLYKDGKKSFLEFDAVAPDGIEGISGPTIIEFKKSFNESVFEFIKQSHYFYPKYKSILLIIGTYLTEDDKRLFKDFSKDMPIDFNFIVWDYQDIIKVAGQLDNNDEIDIIYKNIHNSILDHTVNSAINLDDWLEESDYLINEVNQQFKKDDVVFFIGAGVSKDAGLPTWDELLRSLNISIIESRIPFKLNLKEKDEIINLLTKIQSGTPLVTASYIRKALELDFLEEIRKALYKDVKPIGKQKQLESIAKASRPLIGKLGMKAIITYNFDDLLENHLEKRNIDYKSIYREGDFEIPTKRPVYHVHGFVPSNVDKYPQLDKGLLVFAEDGYHTLQNDPYSWSNLVQLKALRESTCVLIGLSGIDPNLRRLFSNFSQRIDGCKHYILLERQLKDADSSLGRDNFKQFSNLHHKLQEGVFKELGLKVIWYKDYDDIPNIIDRIAESD